MRKVRVKIGNIKLNMEIIVAVLIMAVPFVHLGNFYGYHAKLYFCYALTAVLLVCIGFSVINRISLLKESMILVLFLALSMVTKNFPASVEYFVVMLCGICILHTRFSRKTQNVIINIMASIGVLYALTIIWQWIAPGSFYLALQNIVSEGPYIQAVNAPYLGDYTGFACESNRAGLCIAPAASIYFARVFFSQKNKRVKNIVILGVTYLALLLTGRRAFSIFFSFIMVVGAIYVLMKKKSGISKIAAIVLFITFLVAGYFFLYDRVVTLLMNQSSSGIDISNREVYWRLAIRMFQQSPVIGNGMRSYDYYYNIMSQRNIIFAGAHNCYLQMLAEIGIIGTVLFIVLIIIMNVRTLRCLVFTVRNSYKWDAVLSISSLMMQFMFMLLALSESAFIAPYSLLLYFLILNIANNSICNVNKD